MTTKSITTDGNFLSVKVLCAGDGDLIYSALSPTDGRNGDTGHD